MTPERLFVLTIEDLKEKVDKKDDYSLLRACGLLRHLFIDGRGLFNSVNKIYKASIKFEVAIHEREWAKDSPLQWKNPKPGAGVKTEFLNVTDFLNWPSVFIRPHTYTIRDIIKIASNIKGGIHHGPPDSKELLLINFEKSQLTRYRLDILAMKSICILTIKALEPLIALIKERTPTGGLSPQNSAIGL